MGIHLKNAKKSLRRVSADIMFSDTRLDFNSDIKLDSGFKEFYGWCKTNAIPVVIVSRWDTFQWFTSLSNLSTAE
jgi:2-hydroxy-3-keto-5-methylthiopentenyl-1-phosphate phosphatase